MQLTGKHKRGGLGMEVLKNFVGGSPVAAEVEDELEVPDPATGELLGLVPLSGAADVDRAVRSAAGAFEAWREEPVTPPAREMFPPSAPFGGRGEWLPSAGPPQ